jgi:hypothetical protein
MAYRELVGEAVVDWLGPDQGRLDVPTIYDRDPAKRDMRKFRVPLRLLGESRALGDSSEQASHRKRPAHASLSVGVSAVRPG